MMTGSDVDVPPPGAGLKTVTVAKPPAAISADEIAAVSCVLLTYVVGRVVPFQRTREPGTKESPFTVSVNAGPPAAVLSGETEVTTGTGLTDGPDPTPTTTLSNP